MPGMIDLRNVEVGWALLGALPSPKGIAIVFDGRLCSLPTRMHCLVVVCTPHPASTVSAAPWQLPHVHNVSPMSLLSLNQHWTHLPRPLQYGPACYCCTAVLCAHAGEEVF